MANNPYKPKKKKFTVNTQNMGINIDKNEYYEIITSNSNHPEKFASSNRLGDVSKDYKV